MHHLKETMREALPGIGGALAWLTNTAASAVLGLLVGARLVAVAHILSFGNSSKPAPDDGERSS